MKGAGIRSLSSHAWLPLGGAGISSSKRGNSLQAKEFADEAMKLAAS
jgi:hypothetical protein